MLFNLITKLLNYQIFLITQITKFFATAKIPSVQLKNQLKDVSRKILVLHNVREHFLDVSCIHGHAFLFHVRRVKADFVQHAFHDGVQATRADVLCRVVHTKGKAGNFIQRFARELQLEAFSLKQRGVLLDERRFGLGENGNEVRHCQRPEFNTDGETALQFRDQVTRLGNVESASRDKQDMVCAHHSVARVDRSPFHNGQDVSLHALTGNVRSMAALTSGDLVDFIKEDYPCLFDPFHGDARHLVHVNQPRLLFLDEVLERLAYLHLPLFSALAEDVGQHILDVDVHLLYALVGDDFKGRHGALAHIELHDPLVQNTLPQLLAQLLARPRTGIAILSSQSKTGCG